MKLKDFIRAYRASSTRVDFVIFRKPTCNDSWHDIEELGKKGRYVRIDLKNPNQDIYLEYEVKEFYIQEEWEEDENFYGDRTYEFDGVEIVVLLEVMENK